MNENVNQVNLILLSKSLFRQNPPKYSTFSWQSSCEENGEDFEDHYSYLEMLNATPYNYCMARRSLFQLHL